MNCLTSLKGNYMKNYKKALYIISITLFLGFIAKIIIDCIKYDISQSAPLSIYIVIDAIFFVVPAILCILFVRIFENAKSKKIKESNKNFSEKNLKDN